MIIITKLSKEEIKNRRLGALKRIIEEVEEYRKLPTNMIGGDDISIVKEWLKELIENEPTENKGEKLYKPFKVSSVCRADLINDDRTEEFVLTISDGDMENIGYEMGDDMQEDYWDALEYAIERCLENEPTEK